MKGAAKVSVLICWGGGYVISKMLFDFPSAQPCLDPSNSQSTVVDVHSIGLNVRGIYGIEGVDAVGLGEKGIR
jgi:hypothetical protein